MSPVFRMVLILIMIGSFVIQGCVSTSKKKSAPELRQQIVDAMMDENPSFRWFAVEKQINEREAKEAVYRASMLLVDYPNDVQGYILRGRAYVLEEEFDLALADFTKAIQLSPADPEGFARRGYLYFRHKKSYRRAFADANRAIEMGQAIVKWDIPQRKGDLMVNLFNLRAVLYHKFNQLEPALRDINKAIAMASKEKQKGGLAFFLLRRAYIRRELKRLDTAADDARQALGLYPCLESAYRLLGDIALSRGDLSQCVRYFDKAIDCLPEKKGAQYVNAQAAKAMALWIMGQRHQARDQLKSLIQQTEMDPHIYFSMGYMAHKNGDMHQARSYFLRAKEMMPGIYENKRQQPGYFESERVKSVYQDRVRVAGYYYGSNAKPVETVSRPLEKTLTIKQLSVVPSPVRKNTPFDIETSYFLSDPSASEKDLALTYRFEIHQGTRKLFESKAIRIKGQNARKSVWVQHMNPVSMTGTFRVITYLQYNADIVQAESEFQIR